MSLSLSLSLSVFLSPCVRVRACVWWEGVLHLASASPQGGVSLTKSIVTGVSLESGYAHRPGHIQLLS